VMPERARATVHRAPCESPGEAIIEVAMFGPGALEASARVQISATALRWGGFVVLVTSDTNGAPLACALLSA
jgi:hypothetical protein